jgi:hypothetical protein
MSLSGPAPAGPDVFPPCSLPPLKELETMIRHKLFGLVLMGFTLAMIGCGQGDKGPRTDLPVKSSPAIDPKTGKASKTLDVSIEDPAAKK